MALTEGFGTLGKALRFVESRNDPAEIERAAIARSGDLEVFFSLNQFERRRPYKYLERSLQRDIKEFFGDYRSAQATGFALLMQIADVEAISHACQYAAEHGLGFLEEGLTFRQLIERGETQASTGLKNLPKRPESFNALHDLAGQVLDPVIDYFGMIRLTYGFCSLELAKEIPGRIDPKRDQHAANERNRLGNPVCPRQGAAVDFIVEDESMLEVAQWVAANTPFDRLYFYGDDLPIHVSFGPDHSQQLVKMIPGRSGRLIPRVTPMEAFLALPEA